jgi:hypothetical protein
MKTMRAEHGSEKPIQLSFWKRVPEPKEIDLSGNGEVFLFLQSE